MRQPYVFAHLDGGGRKFLLTLGGIEELEQKCNAGCGAILTRLVTAQFYARDITETLRLGLVGAGQSDADATHTVRNACSHDAFGTFTKLAADILNHAINGIDPDLLPDDAPGEPVAGMSASRATSPASSAPAPGPV